MITVVPTHSADGGEQLVGDAEQRPQRVDPAERVGDALVEEVPHMATNSALAVTAAGGHDTRPNGAQRACRGPAA
jgi:hypothetical protein